jgi:hypothetical protein
MKSRVAAIALLLLLPTALFAAEAPERAATEEGVFPTVSEFQEKAPVSLERRLSRKIETLDHTACGPNPSLPSNCRYVCINGVPQHYPNGEPRVMCWQTPQYPGEGQGCMSGNECDSGVTCWYAPIYEGCNLDQSYCTDCQP